jgi:hypothetical protein
VAGLIDISMASNSGAWNRDRRSARVHSSGAAAKRWLAAHGQQYARLDPIYLGDDLFSRQPLRSRRRGQRAFHLCLQAILS